MTKHLYAYNRGDHAFAAFISDKSPAAPSSEVFVTWEDERGSRAMMERMIARLTPSDEVWVRARGDLGGGRGVQIVEARIRAAGARLIVKTREKKAPHRPRVFQPSAAADRELRRLWTSPDVDAAEVLMRARVLCGRHVQRYHLRDRYKARGKRRK